jgi:hypothetical protein
VPCLPCDGSTYSINDNGTTLAVDGDDYAERRREMSSMRSPDVYDKEAGFRSFSSQKPKSREQKYRSHPIQSSKDMMAGSTSRHQTDMHHKLDLMGGKIERLIGVHSRKEGLLASTQESLDQVFSDFAKFSLDNEKFDLLVDKVVERLHPSIMRGIEKNDANTKRISLSTWARTKEMEVPMKLGW